MPEPVEVFSAPASSFKLEPGRDIHIIACARKAGKQFDGRVLGVRWASRPDFGFPDSGYLVNRVVTTPGVSGPGASTKLGRFFLPSSDSWANFEKDAKARRPLVGPYFPNAEIIEANFGYLLPLVRLADPRTPSAEHHALVLEAAEFFGNTHEHDAELAWKLWRFGQPEPLGLLLASPASAPLIVRYYRQQAATFLMVLAVRFEYAALFGLGTDDNVGDDPIRYAVEAHWWNTSEGTAHGRSKSDPRRAMSRCAPPPPAWLKAERTPGSVGHPAFEVIPQWETPEDLRPADSNGNRATSESLVPRGPAAYTALTWAPPPEEPSLIGYGPVLYAVSRFSHGAATAHLLTPPPLPGGAVFEPLIEGELLIRGPDEPHATDLPGMMWPPLEGHYEYQIRGVDLLGTPSNTATHARLRHHDDFTPPAPRIRVGETNLLVFDATNTEIDVPVDITWESPEDINGPDVAEFRVMTEWTLSQSVGVRVVGVVELDQILVQLTLDRLDGQPDQYAGNRLHLPGGDYPIESHTTGPGAIMTVRKMGSRVPEEGTDGSIATSDPPSALTRVAKLSRTPRVDASVGEVHSTSPFTVTLTTHDGGTLPSSGSIRAYFHLFRGMVGLDHAGGSRWEVVEPTSDSALRSAWDGWIALADPATAAKGSPVVYYPPHSTTVRVTPPGGTTTGLLTLYVSAADGTDYVPSPSLPATDSTLENLTGNESARVQLLYSVRSTEVPTAPGLPVWNPSQRTWADSAARYDEFAQYTLTWTAAAAATRYEVWRALEGAIPGATPQTSDADLRTLGEANPSSFQLRSEQVFGTTYVDYLPGRAPTRALYYICSVNASGEKSAPSSIIGPVYVPDVRAPLAPNLLKAGAAPSSEATEAVKLVFAQPGPVDSVRWDAYYRAEEDGASAAFSLAGSVPADTAADSSGRYSFLHTSVVPGKRYEYRLVAVREALDPIDPSAATTRDIASLPSPTRIASAFASGPLKPPEDLTGLLGATAPNDVQLEWTNVDAYESIEVRRKEEGRYAYQTIVTLDGSSTDYTDESLDSGTWSYELRALGVNRSAVTRSGLEVEVP